MVVNLLSKFKIVMSYLSGEKGEGIPLNGNHISKNHRVTQRMYYMGE